MSLVGGTVTVAGDGSHSGSGLALALFDAIVASPAFATYLGGAAPADKLKVKQAWGELSQALATSLVTYLTSNAVVDLAGVLDSASGALTGTGTLT